MADKSAETAMGILLDSATVYGNAQIAVFGLFITVVFGSLAFSAAISLKSIGKPYNILGKDLSSSSLLVATGLFTFYTINFMSFYELSENARLALQELHQYTCSSDESKDPHGHPWIAEGQEYVHTHECVLRVSSQTMQVFQPNTVVIKCLNLTWPSIGLLVGSVVALIAFLRIANSDRITASGSGTGNTGNKDS